MVLNRKQAPPAQEIKTIELIRPQYQTLDNGIPLYIFDAGEQDLIRIEWVFNPQKWSHSQPLTPFVTHQMLTSGTTRKSAKEIMESVDYYGAFLQTDFSSDKVTLTLFTLNKYFSQILPIVKACLTESICPENEIKIFADTQKQQLSVALQKNDFVARRKFSHLLFGDTSYGYESKLADFEHINREDICNYFGEIYQPNNCEIFVAGKVNQDIIYQLQLYFGTWKGGKSTSQPHFSFDLITGKELFIEKPNAVQSAIRIGKLSINRTHRDFAGLQFVNCMLGGYFGSRLMANIREDKGYTYGIGSALVSLKNSGYLFVGTEVGTEVCIAAMKEIAHEIDVLQNKVSSTQEINLVRNYLLGSFLGGLESAFSHADKFKNIHFCGLDYSYYDHYIKKIKTIEAEEIMHLAQKYLAFDSFNKVIVGKK